jgi:hypothetical protein
MNSKNQMKNNIIHAHMATEEKTPIGIIIGVKIISLEETIHQNSILMILGKNPEETRNNLLRIGMFIQDITIERMIGTGGKIIVKALG